MKIIVPVQTRSRGSTQQQAIPLPPNHSSRHAWLGEVVVVEACLCLIKHWVRLQAPREAWGQWRCFGRGTLLTSERAPSGVGVHTLNQGENISIHTLRATQGIWRASVTAPLDPWGLP